MIYLVSFTQSRIMTKFHTIVNTCWQQFKLLRIKNKQRNAGGLAKLLKLKIGAKVILKVDLDIQDRLINCQKGNISHVKFGWGSAQKVYGKFSDEQVGLKAMRSSSLGRQNYWVPIEKIEAEIQKETKDQQLYPSSTPNFL